MFPTFRVLRRRGDGLHPMFVRAVPADNCCRAWSRRNRVGKRPDSLVCSGGGGCSQLSVCCAVVVTACTLCLCGRCPLTIAAAIGYDDFESGSASKSGWCELEPCSQLDANRVGQRLGYMSSTEINTIPLDNRPRRVLKCLKQNTP